VNWKTKYWTSPKAGKRKKELKTKTKTKTKDDLTHQ